MNKVYLRMGTIEVKRNPSEITTVLGSCVAVCLWDTRLSIGGMNHFKAPHVPPKSKPSNLYGEIAIQNLIKGMLRKGSKITDLRATLFGGGAVIETIKWMNVGKDNIEFAQQALEREGIPVTSSHIGKSMGRRITFNTRNGSTQVSHIKPLTEIVPQKR